MARLVWKVIHATELSDALESSTLGQLVPEQPAVYLWRRRLVAPSSCLSSQEACREWVTQVVGAPAATLTRRQGQLATLVGAAHKAVVYQWEARKRTPSPLFWQRIAALHWRLPERP